MCCLLLFVSLLIFGQSPRDCKVETSGFFLWRWAKSLTSKDLVKEQAKVLEELFRLDAEVASIPRSSMSATEVQGFIDRLQRLRGKIDQSAILGNLGEAFDGLISLRLETKPEARRRGYKRALARLSDAEENYMLENLTREFQVLAELLCIYHAIPDAVPTDKSKNHVRQAFFEIYSGEIEGLYDGGKIECCEPRSTVDTERILNDRELSAIATDIVKVWFRRGRDPFIIKDRYVDWKIRFRNRGGNIGEIEYFDDFLTALLSDIVIGKLEENGKENSSLRTFGNHGHRSWYKLMKCSIRQSEIEDNIQYKKARKLVEELSKPSGEHSQSVSLNRDWIERCFEASKKHATSVYLCLNERALNYDKEEVDRLSSSGLLSSAEDGDCGLCVVEGCTDPEADNYVDPRYSIVSEATCVYSACKDDCYLESIGKEGERYGDNPKKCKTPRCFCLDECYSEYVPKAAGRIHDQSKCLNLLIKCTGCTKPCYSDYNPNAIAGECKGTWLESCDKCDDPCSKIDPDGDCLKECGCRNPLATNGDPDRFTHHDEAACVYDYDKESALRKYEDIFLNHLTKTTSGEKRQEILESIKVKAGDNGDLIASIDFNLNNKALSAATKINFSLGTYYFKDLRDIVFELVNFMEAQSKYLDESVRPKGIIVGEADAAPIRGKGIRFSGHGSLIQGYQYWELEPEVRPKSGKEHLSSLLELQTSPGLETDLEHSLLQSKRFGGRSEPKLTDYESNRLLALVRAHCVLRVVEYTYGKEHDIKLLALANKRRGEQYRRVSILLVYPGFLYAWHLKQTISPERLEEINRELFKCQCNK